MIKTIAATTGIIMTMLVSVLFPARLLIVDELVGLVVGYAAVVLFSVPPFVVRVRFGEVDGTVVFGIVKSCDKVVGRVVSAKVTDADFSVVVTGGCISLLISNGSKRKWETMSHDILHYFWSAGLYKRSSQLIVSIFTFPSQ